MKEELLVAPGVKAVKKLGGEGFVFFCNGPTFWRFVGIGAVNISVGVSLFFFVMGKHSIGLMEVEGAIDCSETRAVTSLWREVSFSWVMVQRSGSLLLIGGGASTGGK